MRGLFKCFGLIRTTGLTLSLLLASLLFCSVASAATYTWSSRYNNAKSPDYSTPAAACDWIKTQASAITSITASVRTPTSGVCPYYFNANAGSASPPDIKGPFEDIPIYRAGDKCEDPIAVLNESTGICETPKNKCEEKAGQKTQFQTSATELMWEACISGCMVAVTEIPYVTQPKSFGPMFAGHNGIFTGEECPQDTPGVDNSAPPVPPTETDTDTDCGPPVRTEDAEGRVHITNNCTTTDITRDNQGCAAAGGSVGMVNGVQACIQANKGPKTTETTKNDTKTDTKNPDGSKSNSNTTTTTTTTCSGGVCKTTTTTTNNTSKTNSDGSPGGSSSTCKGDKCPGTGSGSGSGGGGGGSGSGSGNGDGDDETPKSSVGGEACGTAVTCTGDAIQCAILRQTKKAQCDQEEFQSLKPEKVNAAKQELDTEFSGAEYQPLKSDGAGTYDLSTMIDTSSSVGASCPVLPDINFSFNGMSQSVNIGQYMAELCKYIVWFSYLMVAFAMRTAAEIVARGLS